MEHLNALEVAFPNLTPEEQEMYLRKIRKLYGFFRSIVKGGPSTERPSNCGKSWSSTEETSATEMYKSGKILQDIAKEIGRSAWAIECRLKKIVLSAAQTMSNELPSPGPQ